MLASEQVAGLQEASSATMLTQLPGVARVLHVRSGYPEAGRTPLLHQMMIPVFQTEERMVFRLSAAVKCLGNHRMGNTGRAWLRGECDRDEMWEG